MENAQGTTRVDQVAGGVSLVAGAVLLPASWLLGLGAWREPGPGAWPFLLSIVLSLFGAWLLVRPGPAAKIAAQLPPRWGRLALAFASMLGFVALLVPLGYLVAMALLLLVQFRFVEGRPWLGSLAIAVITSAVSFVVFGLWLKVPLPSGIIPILAG
jgi:hypothetical protein